MEDSILDKIIETGNAVSEAREHPLVLVPNIAAYLAATPVPTRVTTIRSLGRVSFGRSNEHEPGVSLVVYDSSIDRESLAEINRSVAAPSKSIIGYRDVDDSHWDRIDVVAHDLARLAREEQKTGIENVALPPAVAACSLLDGATVRFTGPGSEGRTYFGEKLEGQSALAAWIPPSALPNTGQPDDLVRLTGTERRGNGAVLSEVDTE